MKWLYCICLSRKCVCGGKSRCQKVSVNFSITSKACSWRTSTRQIFSWMIICIQKYLSSTTEYINYFYQVNFNPDSLRICKNCHKTTFFLLTNHIYNKRFHLSSQLLNFNCTEGTYSMLTYWKTSQDYIWKENFNFEMEPIKIVTLNIKQTRWFQWWEKSIDWVFKFEIGALYFENVDEQDDLGETLHVDIIFITAINISCISSVHLHQLRKFTGGKDL